MSKKYPEKPILIVDDESFFVTGFKLLLNKNGINNIITLLDERNIFKILDTRDVGLILLDLIMPNLRGENIIEKLQNEYAHIPVIVISGVDKIEMAVKTMKMGVADYIVKPVEEKRLIEIIGRNIELKKREKEEEIIDELEDSNEFADIITNSKEMVEIFRYIEAISSSFQPLLITGDTGVGKEMIARAVHSVSRKIGKFVAVNIAGVDDTLFSDSLFGHHKGAFTGADRDRTGLLDKATDGTLFFDEIGDLSPLSQLKLLRLLQEGEYYPIGSDKPKLSNARIIAATNKPVNIMNSGNDFRKDLYYRLRTHHIHIPSLKERKEDIPLLLEFFLEESAFILDKKKPTPPPELINLLQLYDFPGNVREFRAMVYDAVSCHKSGILSMDIFKKSIYAGVKNEIEKNPENKTDEIIFPENLPTIKELTELLVEEAMKRSDNNQAYAANMLGITRQALNRRIHKK